MRIKMMKMRMKSMNSRRMKIASKIDIKMKVFNVHMDS
jgi:hypothetical protein